MSSIEVARLRKPGRYAVGHGAYLQVTGDHGRSWVFRYEKDGRGRYIGLGSCSLVGLAEAREQALELRRQVRAGIDPLEARAAARRQAALAAANAVSFKECAKRYIAAHEAGWSNAVHRRQWPQSLEAYVYPVLGALSVAAIDTALVLKAIEPIWTAKPETANRTRGRIEAVLDWAKARGYRDGENPARWRGHLDHLLPARSKVRRVVPHAALAYADIPTFMAELRKQPRSVARALEFTVLTAARIGEVVGAEWGEIAGDVWTVPAERMKSRKAHRVPLTRLGLDLLAALPRTGARIFSSQRRHRPLSSDIVLKLLADMGHAGITVHGFRSSFRDWAAECTNYPNHVVEMALGHAIGNAVEASYRRGDLFEKRRQLMTAWADYCAKPLPTGATVTPIRRGHA